MQHLMSIWLWAVVVGVVFTLLLVIAPLFIWHHVAHVHRLMEELIRRLED